MGSGDGTLLAVSDLNIAYGESRVVFDAHLTIDRGQLAACVGRNGAGKTTLLRTIAGFLTPRSGSVVYKGTPLVGLRPFQIARMGLKYVPQDKRVFSDLTVRENLELGSYASGDYDWERVFGYFPRLRQLLDRKAGYLSGGERQMLMIGRALLGSPSVLLIDEPTEGLAPSVVAHLRDVLKALSRTAGLLIVEQNLPVVSAIADKVYAMKEGRIVAEITDPEAIRDNVCERYL